MKRFLVSLLALAALAACGTSAGSSTSTVRPSAASTTASVAATNRLALALLPRLGGAGNTVFSPYSIQAALAMVDQGAAGQTAAQIDRLLGAANPSALAVSESALAERLRNVAIVPAGASVPGRILPRLNVANGLWLEPSLALEQPFRTTLLNNFGAAPQTLGFAGGPDSARQAINGWVARHTANQIRDVMPPGSITVQTQLVLANAIYLKAHWASPFVKSSTSAAPFFPSIGQRVTVPFMTQPETEFAYTRGPGYQAIDLPYIDSSLSMLLVMPAAGTVGAFERHVSLAQIVGSMRTRLVELRMPRFRLALHAELNPVLRALGMPAAFGDQADFSGISRTTALKIQAVEHGATLSANEQGTVAAAATGVSLQPTAIPGGPAVRLTLDRPFLLFLRERDTGAVLFAGRVVDPSGS